MLVTNGTWGRGGTVLRRAVTLVSPGIHGPVRVDVRLTRRLSGGVFDRVQRCQRRYSNCYGEQPGRAAVRRELAALHRAADRGGVPSPRYRGAMGLSRTGPPAGSGLSRRDHGMRMLVWRTGRICEACAQQQDTEYREPECVDDEPTTAFRTGGGYQVASLDCGARWCW